MVWVTKRKITPNFPHRSITSEIIAWLNLVELCANTKSENDLTKSTAIRVPPSRLWVA
jgi:hypothetical protein